MSNIDDENDFVRRRREKAQVQKNSEELAEQQPDKSHMGAAHSPVDNTVVGFVRQANYKAGMELLCRIISDEPGGYSVMIVQSQTPGFLPTQAFLEDPFDE
jgi:hypothetical protein